MRRLLLGIIMLAAFNNAGAQAFINIADRIPPVKIKSAIAEVQADVRLYSENVVAPHSKEHDVNSIILDIEKYIETAPKEKSVSDKLLMKQFDPLRHFFLTTSNKTTVAASFLSSGAPYRFCNYNDTAVVLYLYAVKDGNIYNPAKTTEKKIMKTSLEQCLLPSLKALDQFKPADVAYVALSVYYGYKDTRDGAASGQVTPYCLTLLARLADVQQYAAGLITAKGLLSNGELYLSDADNAGYLSRVGVSVE